jgi:hypothetical protein
MSGVFLGHLLRSAVCSRWLQELRRRQSASLADPTPLSGERP